MSKEIEAFVEEDDGSLPESQVAKSGLDFPVIGLGASAGGLQTLIRIFEGLPAAPDMAFVVILHLSPRHESKVADILQKSTRMPVREVAGDVPIERDHVYVIPPNRELHMVDGKLGVRPSRRTRGPHVAIDLFFRTLADAHGDRSIGVVLSGTGADGSVGIARLKDQGGLVLAQSPEDAEYEGMPSSAIATGMVDFVLPTADIPQKLLDLWRNARSLKIPQPEIARLSAQPEDNPAIAEAALDEVMAILLRRTGHDFSHYKRATVLRRIERRMQVCGTPDLPTYRQHLRQHAAEAPALLGDMLIGVTNFFRDREAFEALEREVMPTFFDARFADEPLRVWVPGCSTGEEAYSIGMLLRDEAARAEVARPVQVFASDIDEAALSVARDALYPGAIATDVTVARLRSFFVKEDAGYRINRELREHVLFARHDILRDPPFSRLDLVSCRNLLIYLDKAAQNDILQMFHFALRPGGYLFLGSSESADAAPRLFTAVDKRLRIYRSNVDVRSTRTLPTFPLGSVARSPRLRPVKPPLAGPRKRSMAELHQQLLEEHAPPSVIVNRDAEIIHLSSRAGRYLRFGGGEPSHRLLDVVQPELRSELRTLLFQATLFSKGVESRRVDVSRDGQLAHVKMTARPVEHPELPNDLLLVLFDEVEVAPPVLDGDGNLPERDPLVFQLQSELQRKDDQLRATIEQYESSAEELKASNEELQAINEELRSTTEELETSKEELQSTNEELITVNQELKMKVDETTDVNDDLQNLIAATQIATVFVDAGMRIKRFTPAARSIFNIIDSDVGRSLLDITHKLLYPTLADDAEQTFATLRPIEREVESTDGRWFLGRVLPYRSADDRIGGAVLTFVDITSRRRAEHGMHIGEAQMALVAASMPDFAIMTLDREGRFTSWSAGAERVFGWSEAEVMGESFERLFLPADREQKIPERELQRAAESGRASDDRWHVRKDGSTFFANGVTTPLRTGGLEGFAKIAFDATRKMNEEHARQHELASARIDKAQALADSDLKSEFLAVMSHELKHPLNLINVNTQVLMTLPEAQNVAPVMKAARTIQRTVQSQARIIDDLLDLSRTHAGKLTLERQPLWLGDALQTVLNGARQEATAKGLEFHYTPDPEPLLVDGDLVRIEQIAWNLLSNAIKFTKVGRIDVALRRDGEQALLEVADSGRGIAPQFVPHVFEMFRQADSQTTREAGGLGIGLALVAGLVDLHGGRVAAESPGLGLGSTFRVWLPLHERTDLGALEPELPSEPRMKGVRVLLVDDTTDTLETFSFLLEADGMVVHTASSGAAAIELATSHEFDLVISDIGMPGMDGYELIQRLRTMPSTARVPAIALTGYGRPQDVQRALASGFSAHLDKPIDFSQLGRVFDQLLRSRRSEAPSGQPPRRR
ncbi:chemotaxis protein CheB [Piscinibacter koreensis]|uniref:PAS domain-containing protein n=1 Tax=Piscinibacter koreensis TaxID=2742824 RepID=A0A7Y6TW17_9BURK|nr:chemotaxis protein CheB [Schlegelella koreensis]NUZ05568.1 PAS domain-containing protein [Schlegelella koreensis]